MSVVSNSCLFVSNIALLKVGMEESSAAKVEDFCDKVEDKFDDLSDKDEDKVDDVFDKV